MSLPILLNGSAGRMGKAIIALAEEHNCDIVSAVDMGDDITVDADKAKVFVDFSFHEATLKVAELAAEKGAPLVIGTTGHTAEEKEAIAKLAEKIPMVWAGNFSVGVNLLFWLTKHAASILTPEYNPEIVEMHHNLKKDAPSGTAERLLEVVREARKLSAEQVMHGREGIVGERPQDEIGMHALRGGEVVGEHTVMFAGPGERLELTHRAADRKIFASGVLRSAHWVLNKEAGIYNMEDVLGLK